MHTGSVRAVPGAAATTEVDGMSGMQGAHGGHKALSADVCISGDDMHGRAAGVPGVEGHAEAQAHTEDGGAVREEHRAIEVNHLQVEAHEVTAGAGARKRGDFVLFMRAGLLAVREGQRSGVAEDGRAPFHGGDTT